jgi:hypothetical protein
VPLQFYFHFLKAKEERNHFSYILKGAISNNREFFGPCGSGEENGETK